VPRHRPFRTTSAGTGASRHGVAGWSPGSLRDWTHRPAAGRKL